MAGDGGRAKAHHGEKGLATARPGGKKAAGGEGTGTAPASALSAPEQQLARGSHGEQSKAAAGEAKAEAVVVEISVPPLPS